MFTVEGGKIVYSLELDRDYRTLEFRRILLFLLGTRNFRLFYMETYAGSPATA